MPRTNRLRSIVSLISALCLPILATPGQGVERRAFITSLSGNGDFSSWSDTDLDGFAGADEICRDRAAAGGLDNAAAYRAWLSTAATDAYCHLFGLTGDAPSCNGANPNASLMGPWVRVDGSAFAGNLAELAGSKTKLFRPVLFNEFGAVVLSSQFWTATNWDGEAIGGDCAGWASDSSGTGNYGYSDVVGRGWTYWSGESCGSIKRLVCFEPGAGDPSALPGTTGAIAFVTSTTGNGDLSTWADTNVDGVIGADEICRARAAAGRLPRPSTFFALISDAGTDAAHRLNYAGPYVRVDGVVLVDQVEDLTLPTIDLKTGLNVAENEAYLGIGVERAWTGSNELGVAVVDRCSDWSSTSGDGESGDPMRISAAWWTGNSPGCSASHRLYCFTNTETLFWDHFERGDVSRWSAAVP